MRFNLMKGRDEETNSVTCNLSYTLYADRVLIIPSIELTIQEGRHMKNESITLISTCAYSALYKYLNIVQVLTHCISNTDLCFLFGLQLLVDLPWASSLPPALQILVLWDKSRSEIPRSLSFESFHLIRLEFDLIDLYLQERRRKNMFYLFSRMD